MRPTVATLNFTDRKRIERSDVRITGHTSGLDGVFLLEKLDLASYDFDPSALIVVECFTGKIGFQRYVHGRIDEIELYQLYPHKFPAADLPNATFRVKVVSTAGQSKGRILGDADNIPVEFGGRPPSIIAVDPADIGDLVWALEFSEESGPKLLINERIPDPQQIVMDTEFRATVMPKVVEEIALWVAEKLENELDIYGQKWKRALSVFNVNFDTADTSTPESRRDLAERVSRAFARHHCYIEKFKDALDRRQQ